MSREGNGRPEAPADAAADAAAAWNLDEIDDENAWLRVVPPGASSSDRRGEPGLGELLRRLERQLRCDICGNLMRLPTKVVPCGHTFCSECVRTQLLVERKNPCVRSDLCPHGQCRTPLHSAPGGDSSTLTGHERCLVPNRDLQNIVDTFQSLRAPLLRALRGANASSSPGGDRRRGRNQQGDSSSDDGDQEIDPGQRPAPAKKKPKGPPAKDEEPMKHRILPVKLKSMKAKELRELCREVGVDARGSEADMRSRLDRFCVYWNARFARESASEIRDGFERREKEHAKAVRDDARAGAARDAELLNRMFERRTSEITEATTTTTTTTTTSVPYESTGDRELDRKLKGGFAALIAAGRRRQQEAKEKLRREKEEEAAAKTATHQPSSTPQAPEDPVSAGNGSPPDRGDAQEAAAPSEQTTESIDDSAAVASAITSSDSSNQYVSVGLDKPSPFPGNGSPTPNAPGQARSESSPSLTEDGEHHTEERSPASPTRGVGPSSLATSTAANRSERETRHSPHSRGEVDLPSMFVDLTDDAAATGPNENDHPGRSQLGMGPTGDSAPRWKEQRPGGRTSDGASSSSSTSSSSWQCPRCTLINIDKIKCQLCELVHLSREYVAFLRTAREEGRLLDAT